MVSNHFIHLTRFIISNIRNNMDYSQRSFYWLGAEYSKNSDFEWTDGSKMSFTGWLPGHEKITKPPTDLLCLGLQWKSTPTPMLPSGLYWAYQKCSNVGGYICKQNKKNNVFIQNQTITGIEGRLTSPGSIIQYLFEMHSFNTFNSFITPRLSQPIFTEHELLG